MEDISGLREKKTAAGQLKNICTAILAHVDAGKTTLSEALLCESGMIRRAGRVDKKDAFLDNHALERARGITIFSKQAVIKTPDGTAITLLDTPGHVDFSAEMERTLTVPDYAILVISGADGVQAHTKTLWRLLARYRIPVFLFINKMDQEGTDRVRLMQEFKSTLDGNCVDFSDTASDAFSESVAVCDEQALERYLERGVTERREIVRLIRERKLFPCYFGSALKLVGVDSFLEGFLTYTEIPAYPETFGARIFKIARDASGVRLTYLKITGGSLKVRQVLRGRGRNGAGDEWEEKVNQIRVYSGEKYETEEEVPAGCICAVTGLTRTYPGEGLGAEAEAESPVLEPVLTYRVILPEGMEAAVALPKLRQLEEEEPQLRIVWNEERGEILAQLMGEVQLQILQSLARERFQMEVGFDSGSIVYRETIAAVAEGVGHFEPLRHYAEVHLLLEPGDPGSGLVTASACSEDLLDRNWQRLVLSHLTECGHPGVLTGACITDLKITLVSGRAHLKHTEGGDFRQATFRALRQGLMQAQPVLLEPCYDFQLEVPEQMLGRAMTDIERMQGTVHYDEPPAAGLKGQAYGEPAEGGIRILTGTAPVATMQNYHKEVVSYTKGLGRLSCTPAGYRPCHNAEEVIRASGYDPERDTQHPCGSVFCAHGAGFVVSWDKVWDYMHLGRWLEQHGNPEDTGENGCGGPAEVPGGEEIPIGTDEIDRILERTYNANKRKPSDQGKKGWKLRGRREGAAVPAAVRTYRTQGEKIRQEEYLRSQEFPGQEEYLLVDGYNIIFAWEELKRLAEVSVDGARGKLLDILCNYQGIRGCQLIVVFDAYRVQGHRTEILDYHNIHVVYTKEAETADQYIEKFAHENARRHRVTVATSDGLEQVIIRGEGCILLSAMDLREEVAGKSRQVLEDFERTNEAGRTFLPDAVLEEIRSAVGRGSESGPEEKGAF